MKHRRETQSPYAPSALITSSKEVSGQRSTFTAWEAAVVGFILTVIVLQVVPAISVGKHTKPSPLLGVLISALPSGLIPVTICAAAVALSAGTMGWTLKALKNKLLPR